MTRPTRFAVTLTALALLACAAVAQQQGDEVAAPPEPPVPRPAAADRSWESFRETIVLGNIFLPNRGELRRSAERETREPDRPERDQREAEPAPPRDPGDRFALRGVSYIGETHRAFFEDLSDGSIRTLIVGDTLAGRRLEEINLDTVRLAPLDSDEASPDEAGAAQPTEPYTIEIGWALSGSQSPAAAASGTRRPATPTDASATSDDDADAADQPDDEELSVIERLRRRRQQQINE